METPDEKWFRERLRHFLEIRHPPRQFHHVMIERRSRLAFESYAQSVELGVPAASAVRAADKVLFRGLLFSKYDTVHLILTTAFRLFRKTNGRRSPCDWCVSALRSFGPTI